MRKRIFSAMLTIVLSISIIACGTSTADTVDTATKPEVTEAEVVEQPEETISTEEQEEPAEAEEDPEEAAEPTEETAEEETPEPREPSKTAIEVNVPVAEPEIVEEVFEATPATEQTEVADVVANIPIVNNVAEVQATEAPANEDPVAPVVDTAQAAEIAPPYYIEVNRTANIVRVWCNQDASGNWTTLVREMVCSTGRPGHETPAGTYSIYEHTDGGGYHLMVDGTYGRYCMRWLSGGYMFHSVCYSYNGAPEPIAQEVADLGTSVSRGCIRLSVADAEWMYNNMSNGTTVHVY